MQSKTNSSDSSDTGSIRRATSNMSALLALNQPDVYICSRCSRGFPSSQSLGGHQNAHRRERNAERKQMMEERKLILEKIKMTEMNILSSLPPQPNQPLVAFPPPTPPTAANNNNNHSNRKPHYVISLDKLGADHNGPLAGLKTFLAFQAQMGAGKGQGLPPLPAPSAFLVAANNNHHEVTDHDEIDLINEGEETPNGVASVGTGTNPANPYRKFMPWEVKLCPDCSNSGDNQEVKLEEDASAGGSKNMDLNLKL